MKDAEEVEPEPHAAADPPPAPPDPGEGAEGWFSTAEPPPWLSARAFAVFALDGAAAAKLAVATDVLAAMSSQPGAL